MADLNVAQYKKQLEQIFTVDTEPLRQLQDRRLLERVEEYRSAFSSST